MRPYYTDKTFGVQHYKNIIGKETYFQKHLLILEKKEEFQKRIKVFKQNNKVFE